MPEFHETIGGRRFYGGTMPRIADALERIAKSLENLKVKDVNQTIEDLEEDELDE